MPAKDTSSNELLGNLSESVASYVSAKLGLSNDDSIKKIIDNQVKQTKVLRSIEKNIETAISSSSAPAKEPSVAGVAPVKVAGEKSELAKEEGPQKVEIVGYSQEGWKQLENKLPEILEESFEGIEKKLGAQSKGGEKEGGGGFLSGVLKVGLGMIAGGGLAIIGGLAALVKGIMDDGPFKGLLKLLSRIGIEGGIELVKRGAEKVIKAIKTIVEFFPEKLNFIKDFFENIATRFAKPFELLKKVGLDIPKMLERVTGALSKPFDLFKSLGNKITGVFDSIKGFASNLIDNFTSKAGDVFKLLPKGGFLEKIGGVIASTFSKVLKFAKKLPFGIGTAIGLGFAISRMVKGDFVGGLIDVASALATLVPGIGTGLSYGIDAIGMLLDFKAGGETAGEKSAKKGSIIMDFLAPIGKKLVNGLKMLPIIGPAIKGIEHFIAGEWGSGLKQLAYILPPLEIIGGMLGDESVTPVSKGAGKGLSWILGKMFDVLVLGLKKVPVIGPLIKALTAFDDGDIIEGLKQLAYMFPPLEMIGGLLGDRKADSAVGLAGQGAGWLIEKITEFLGWALPKTPVFGPLIKAVQSFMDGDILKGFKHLAYMFPPFEFIGGLLGDTETSSFVGGMGQGVGSLFKKMTDWALEKLSNKPIFGPLIRAAGEFADGNWLSGLKFLAYMIPPLEFIGGLLGDKDTVSIAGAAGEVTGNFFGKVKDWIVENLSNKPVIGPLIKAITAFKDKEWLRGLKYLAYMVPSLEFIGGLLGDEDTVSIAGSAGAGAKNILSSIYGWFKENIEKVPFIGSLIRAGRAFGDGEWLKGLKLLAYMIPPLEFLGGMFGDTDASGFAGEAGAGTVNIIGGIIDWVKGNAKRIPIVGQLIQAVEAFKAGDWKEGLVQLGRMINPVQWIVDLFSGDEEGPSIGEKAINFIKGISDWVMEKIYDVPILGDIARGIELFASDPMAALKAMGRKIPVIRGIIKFFDTEEPAEGGGDVSPPKSPFQKLKESLIEKAREWWKNTYKWVRWLAEKILPNDVVKLLNEDKPVVEDTAVAKGGADAAAATATQGESVSAESSNKKFAGFSDKKSIIKALKELGYKSWSEIPKDVQQETIENYPLQNKASITEGTLKKLVRIEVDRELQGASVKATKDTEEEDIKKQLQKSQTTSETPTAAVAPVEEKKGFWASMFGSTTEKKEQLPAMSPAVPAPVQAAVANNVTTENEKIQTKIENPQILEPNTNANITPAAAVTPSAAITPAPAAKESSVIDTIKNAASNVFGSSGPTAVKIEGSMESLLGAIVTNTGGTNQNIKNLIGGFNNLAQALEQKLGVPMPTVTPSNGPSMSEYAQQGNPAISNFRSAMEGARPRPS